MFDPGDEVEAIGCVSDPRLNGKKGWIIDEIPPFNGLWTVTGMPGLFTPNTHAFRASELRKTGHRR